MKQRGFSMSDQYSGQMIVDLMNTVGKMTLRRKPGYLTLSEWNALVTPTPSQGKDVAAPSASPRVGDSNEPRGQS
jgi:hypothetical protein